MYVNSELVDEDESHRKLPAHEKVETRIKLSNCVEIILWL